MADEGFYFRAATFSVDHIGVVVDDRSITHDNFKTIIQLDFPGHLGVQDPILSVSSCVSVDGQRTAPGHLFHQIHTEIQPLEGCSQFETKSGFPHPVGADKCNFHMGIKAPQEKNVKGES